MLFHLTCAHQSGSPVFILGHGVLPIPTLTSSPVPVMPPLASGLASFFPKPNQPPPALSAAALSAATFASASRFASASLASSASDLPCADEGDRVNAHTIDTWMMSRVHAQPTTAKA